MKYVHDKKYIFIVTELYYIDNVVSHENGIKYSFRGIFPNIPACNFSQTVIIKKKAKVICNRIQESVGGSISFCSAHSVLRDSSYSERRIYIYIRKMFSGFTCE